MKTRRVAAVFVAAGLGATGVGQWRAKRGRVRVSGLGGPVEIVVDRWGVPHIYADSELDAFFGQGFMHARERLFQMETSRRAPQGKLSAVFGRKTLEVDRFLRRMGLHRAAVAELAALDGETRGILEAYTAGVNAGAASVSLPLEFRLLRFRFEPWSALDSVAFGRMMALNLSCNWDTELARAEMLADLGVDRAARIEPQFSDEHPVVLGGVNAVRPAIQALRDELERVGGALGPGGGMSNAWALAPGRSTTGRPLLANDPHLAPQLPSTWYECEIQAPGLHVTGASLPGLPGIMIGHNDRIGWGVTASMADVQDVVVFPASDLASAPRVVERIEVKGAPAVFEEVTVTEHGPMLERQADGRGLVLKSTILDPRPLAPGIFGVMRAGDWAEFRAATSRLVAPALCYTYADVAGNIGFQLAGAIPRRRGGAGLLPWPAVDERFGWDGYLPWDEMPGEYNPAGGLLVNANNQIEQGPSLRVPGEFVDGYRARRIRQMATAPDRLSLEDCRTMQGDVRGLHAAQFMQEIADWEPSEPRLRAALVRLRGWDGGMRAASGSAALFEAFFLRCMWNVIEGAAGPHVRAFLGRPTRGLGNAPPLCWRATSLTLRALETTGDWFRRPADREVLLSRSLHEALIEVEQRLGANPARWRWGDLHRLRWRHALSAIRPLSPVFSRGSVALGGDMHTVWQTAYHTYDPYDVRAWTVSYRQLLDIGDWEKCLSVHAPGQSGRVGNRHYADLIAPWSRVEYHPMTFSRESLRPHVERTIVLEPI